MDSEAIVASLAWLEAEGFSRVVSAPGFVTIFFGVNLEAGKGVGVTFWDSAAAMRESEKIEAPVREESLRLARADRTKGLSDTYRVVFTDIRPAGSGATLGRLARWEGISPASMRDAYDYFFEHELPGFQDVPGYRGIFLGSNPLLGNTLSVTLWEDQDLETVERLERQATAHIEAGIGRVRPTIIDTYQVAVLPELPQLQMQL
jgi:heme-degrading monooxygenase HmoA